ncbi:chemotaxis protein CheW [Geomonas subterranea]|uniref:Chemotaxis protein CheW n=1 Tax=Geomonas subterranea TaxID=2847989 RepID=A0ABX8LJP3_9BACT|nr:MULTISPECIES: chemotaxis protein CheW [Geomonas]QXE90869.1 chemotaxis protein CheW [Geomonas subterranea]QXM11046.1 chemotaxis protein CheW [Geomonas subterranea]
MQTAQGNAVEQQATEGGSEYLTFTLGNESYGIDILKVQEIRGYDCVTRIANTPAFIKGVINLRGVIVPIVDLRIKFNVGEATYHEFTVVIIINVLNKVVGIVVDGVSDVVALPAASIKPAPELGASLDTRYITGLGTLNDEMLILVDIEKLIGSDELQIVDSSVENTQKEAVNL